MSPLKVLLAVSVAANVALLAVWVRPKPNPAAHISEAMANQAEAPVASDSSPEGVNETTDRPVSSAELTPTNFKSELERLVQQLQAAGFPRRMIVDVVQHLTNRLASATYAELHRLPEGSDAYWKAPAFNPDPERMREGARIHREIQAAIQAVLGPDYFLENDTAVAQLRSEYGPLAPEKLVRIQAIRRDYDELKQEMYAEAASGEGMTLIGKERSIQQAFRDELAQLLTPQELFEYDLRSSATARRLRDQFHVVGLTEAEFRTLFALYQSFDQKHPDPTPGAPNWSHLQRERRAAEPQLIEQAKALFSSERAAEIAQAADSQARQENRLVARLGLPISTAIELSALRRDAFERGAALRQDNALSPDQRRDAMAALANEAEQRIGALLGERGFSAYREYGGQWLESMRNAPPQR